MHLWTNVLHLNWFYLHTSAGCTLRVFIPLSLLSTILTSFWLDSLSSSFVPPISTSSKPAFSSVEHKQNDFIQLHTNTVERHLQVLDFIRVLEATILILLGAGLRVEFQQFLAKTFSRGPWRQKQVVFLIITPHQTQNLHGVKS